MSRALSRTCCMFRALNINDKFPKTIYSTSGIQDNNLNSNFWPDDFSENLPEKDPIDVLPDHAGLMLQQTLHDREQ